MWVHDTTCTNVTITITNSASDSFLGGTATFAGWNGEYLYFPSFKAKPGTRFYAEQMETHDFKKAMKLLSQIDSREAMATIHELYSPPHPPVAQKNSTRVVPVSMPRKTVGLRKTCEFGMRQARLRGEYHALV